MPPTCKELVKDYCSNCTFAGVHFIADDTKHWTERWFWVLMIVASWYGSALLIIASWEAFVTSPISFGVETTYLEWNTHFPGIGICENDNLERVYDVSDTIWTPDHAVDLEEVLKELAYFRGNSFYTLQFCNRQNVDPLCPLNNFSYYANLVRSDCKSSIADCSYNGVPLDCCAYFQPLETDVGRCYIMNSLQTSNPKKIPMVINTREKIGIFRMEVLVPARVYTIGEEEVPALTTLQSSTLPIVDGVKYNSSKKLSSLLELEWQNNDRATAMIANHDPSQLRHIAVRNIENDPLAVETSIEQRACRYTYENEGGVYPQYSYSACTVLCRKRAQKQFCQCNDHFMPGTPESERCNMSGLACLNLYYSDLTALRPSWAQRKGLVCDCLPSCTETDITIIKDEKIAYPKKTSAVEINLEYLPTERFKRNVVRSRLDLVVSVGGTTGLFVGASLLSFVELLVYLTIRYYGSVYMERHPNRVHPQETDEQEASAMEYLDPNGMLVQANVVISEAVK